MADIKCGPDGCPIIAFSDLTPAEQRVQRKRIAAKMVEQGFTEQQIAKQLGYSQQTISNDLSNLPEISKSKPAKTESNPKGAGRPKGSKQRRINETAEAQAAAVAIVDGTKTYQEIERETGFSSTVLRSAVAREEGRREAPQVAPETLALTAQQKLDAALRQHRQKLDAQFEQRVRDDIRRRIDELILPHWKDQIAKAEKLYALRKGAMDKLTFNKIRRALHPDSRQSISDEKLAEAFDTFMSLEKHLLDEKDSPTSWPNIPSTLAEWDKMKAAARKPKKQPNGQAIRPR